MTRIDTTDQLDALPIGSIIRLGSGQVFVRVDGRGSGWDWECPGDEMRWGAADVLAEHDGPHTLLFAPGRDLVQEAKAEGWDEGYDDGYGAGDLGRESSNPYRDEAP